MKWKGKIAHGVLAGVMVWTLSALPVQGLVVIRTAPPPPLVERPGAPLHPGWVWTGGYYRWNGVRYVWVPGRWLRPPRARAVWVPGHWVARPRGWVFVPGHWRY